MGHGSVSLEGKTPKAALFWVFCFLLSYNIKRIKSKTENNKILHKDFKLDKAYPPKIAPCGDFFKGVTIDSHGKAINFGVGNAVPGVPVVSAFRHS